METRLTALESQLAAHARRLATLEAENRALRARARILAGAGVAILGAGLFVASPRRGESQQQAQATFVHRARAPFVVEGRGGVPLLRMREASAGPVLELLDREGGEILSAGSAGGGRWFRLSSAGDGVIAEIRDQRGFGNPRRSVRLFDSAGETAVGLEWEGELQNDGGPVRNLPRLVIEDGGTPVARLGLRDTTGFAGLEILPLGLDSASRVRLGVSADPLNPLVGMVVMDAAGQVLSEFNSADIGRIRLFNAAGVPTFEVP